MASDGSDSAQRTTSPSIELVRRIQAGDTVAWEQLYRRYRDPMLLSIRCRLGPHLRTRLQSEDVLQSVWADVVRSDLASYTPGHGSFERFLHACVLNKIRNKADWFGAHKRANDTPLTDSVADQVGASATDLRYHDSDRYERLERAMAQLPDDLREALLLRRIEGLDNIETARMLGKTPAAASKLYNRALARLGALLQPEAP